MIKNLNSNLDKAKYINDHLKNKLPVYGKIIEGERAGTIGQIVSGVERVNNLSIWSLRRKKVSFKIEGRRLCSYLLSNVEILPGYTGATVFIENKIKKEIISPKDFLGQPITVGMPVFFQRTNSAIMARVKSIDETSGNITVQPLKIDDIEYNDHRIMRLYATDKILGLNKTTLDAVMLLKLRV